MLKAMSAQIQRLRERTNGYTVTPSQYARVAWAALGALALIVLSGAAVRLTGSGLGCDQWPKCGGNVYPPLTTHAVIEFSNRLVTVPVSIAAILAWVLALRRRPYRRDLVWLSATLPLGVMGQAVLGGLTVRGALDYGWVMGHFALSMLIVACAWALVWRSRSEPGQRETSNRGLVICSRVLVALAGLTIFAGTAATAAGPHAGGSPGQKINRLQFDGRGTMDFVIHRHGEIALTFGVVALLMWWLARRLASGSTVQRASTSLCALLALQGAVGLDQYETHLPTELVWVHVGLACATWIVALWVASAAGAPRLRPAAAREQLGPAASAYTSV
jgi:cytochrome c oxidase assembly protein subunit 15